MAKSRLCSIPDCGKPHEARGYCNKHYKRLRAFGDPLGGNTFEGEPLAWLHANVGHSGAECLIWPYGMQGNGYSVVKLNGSCVGAYRLMCELAHGKAPTPGHEAAHSCGDRRCVHPKHLRWATREENQSDRIEHDTHNRGSRSPFAKLSEDDVIMIRSLYGTMRQIDIAAKFNVSRTTIRDVASGTRWSWV